MFLASDTLLAAFDATSIFFTFCFGKTRTAKVVFGYYFPMAEAKLLELSALNSLINKSLKRRLIFGFGLCFIIVKFHSLLY